jgi:hypothetical protein
MSAYIAVIRLINSLSSSEKRSFKLFSGKHKGHSEYIGLFDLICANTIPNTDRRNAVAADFKKKFPGSSIDHTARYLIKLITDLLIRTKIEKDNEFKMWHSLLRVKILQERSLPEESYRELKKIRETAANLQNYPVQYIALREELNFVSEQRYYGITDQYIIDMQMMARETLRMMHSIEEHYSLYELLQYRLMRLGKAASEESRKKLDDLLLSEVSLVTGKIRNTFESRKLHLLFQSFYFIYTGDYSSAVRCFYDLNRLFEQYPQLHGHPPVDYFSALDGVLDSLRSIRHFDEMFYYVDKLRVISNEGVPDYFRGLIDKTITLYTLAAMLGKGEYNKAVEFIEALPESVFSSYQIVNDEKQAELCFYCSLVYYHRKMYKKAHKYLFNVLNDYSNFSQQPIYKAIRLLNMIIHYTLKDMTYLESDIRAYRRWTKIAGLSKTATAIVKTLLHHPGTKTRHVNAAFLKKLSPALDTISKDRYERQILKYFDFIAWIRDNVR